MLSAAQFDQLTVPTVNLYNDYIDSILADIARRLSGMDMTSTAAWQTQRLIESGALYQDVITRLSTLTGKSESVLRETFKKAGVRGLEFDDRIYKAAGLNPLPLNLSPAMQAVLLAGLEKTGGIMRNLTMTTALTAQESFIKAADLAYLQVSQGAMSYDDAIRQAIKNVAGNGLQVIDYASGRRDQLDVAMRRTVLTGVGQTTGKLQEARADEMGQDLVETSAHIGARPSHQLWQGKVFSRSGTDPKYPPFVESTGYGTGPGLQGWNCRHSFYPFFAGISERIYKDQELETMAGKTIKYNGQDISIYDATQVQREIERKIRYWKRQASALEAGKQTNTGELAKVAQYQKRMRDFITQMNKQDDFIWYRQRAREQIANGSLGAVSKVAPPVVKVLAPNGIPVSDAIDFSGIKNKDSAEQIKLALSAIDKVHGDGQLRKIPIITSSSKRAFGMFRAYEKVGMAKNISITTSGDHKALTMLHEIGHYIDHSGTGRLWGITRYTGEADDLINAMRKSEWFSGLFSRVESLAKSSADGVFRIDRKYIRYLATTREMFARAYAQFIAIESGDTVILAQLRKLQSAKLSTQWSDEDFEPIAEEFRKYFKTKEWTK